MTDEGQSLPSQGRHGVIKVIVSVIAAVMVVVLLALVERAHHGFTNRMRRELP